MRGCVYDASQTQEIGRRQGRDGLWSVLGTVPVILISCGIKLSTEGKWEGHMGMPGCTEL